MVDVKQSAGLRIIFSLFLGLMLTTFAGIGVYTFHPPSDQYDQKILDLRRREQVIRNDKPSDELTAADRDEIREIMQQRYKLEDAAKEARKPWSLSTSIILMIFATLCMVISLMRPDRLPVISTGILMGGVFTMLYGVAWIISTTTSITRFLVMTLALVITVGLGYIRFARSSVVSSASESSRIAEGEELAEVARRVYQLEDRMNEAARALGSKSDP